MRIKKKCAICGSSFSCKASHADKRTHCSTECMATAYKKQMVGPGNPNYKNANERFCECCGKRYESYQKNRKFCSQGCYQKSRKAKKGKPLLVLVSPQGKIGNRPRKRTGGYCLNCGDWMYFSPSQGRKYCSYQCHLDDGGAKRAGMAAVMAIKKYGAKKDANHKEIVTAFEKMGAQCLDLSAVGCGVPDLLVWHKSTNRVFMVDVKNPKTGYGKRGLNDLQKEWADNWTGCTVYLVYRDRDAENLVKGNYEKVKSYSEGAPFTRMGKAS